MKINVHNLGVIKQAEFELGDLTIICGKNNSGKTYVAYAVFGFLATWREGFDVEIANDVIDRILNQGLATINLNSDIDSPEQILSQACQAYTKNLAEIFGAERAKFAQTSFEVFLDLNGNFLDHGYETNIGASGSNQQIFSLIKLPNSPELTVTLLAAKENIDFPRQIIKKIISDAIKYILFARFFPRPFIASAERTGTAIFRKELNFARNRLLNELSQVEGEKDRFELLFQSYEDYALPIRANVEFVRNLEAISKRNSQLGEINSSILDYFDDIIGGRYVVTKNDELYYIPTGNKKAQLTMDESSSAVRSLLDIGFYLKHIAQVGELLIIDEPELNLHPENQRRIARLMARLINSGIKVLITTHSDYIVKELNTLIMLNSDKPHIQKIAEQAGYQQDEILDASRVRAYIAEAALVQLSGKSRRTRCPTLIAAPITPELGIEISSFDSAIEAMNKIQEAIVWGEGF
ncbi:AAA family ATPase [Spirulina sp. CCNP1310]|uniref:AAA family ATPase n=1 Tax=Spirulina sp. CCNP1310 TaxID=3110249 RepID=UPI003A4C8419